MSGVLSGWLLEATSYVTVFSAMAVVLGAASAFVTGSLRAPRERKKDGRLTLYRFHKAREQKG